jgi:opine dehydrogenase
MSRELIGIYGVSTQSGLTTFADLADRGLEVYGYARPTEHGRKVVEAVQKRGAVRIERPQNLNNEISRDVVVRPTMIGHDLERLAQTSSIVLFALPSHFHVAAAALLRDAGLPLGRTPLVLMPARTYASPYLWLELGQRHPIICFATSPYSCKAFAPDTVYIKRRKRSWLASLEGDVSTDSVGLLQHLFPQAAVTRVPALTSLNNIGAVFHPAPYVINRALIEEREASGEPYSYYMEGICANPTAAKAVSQIDQVRLRIAAALGLRVFGLDGDERDDLWRKLTNAFRALEEEHEDDIVELRSLRRHCLESLSSSVVSAQHWLDITYGVVRIPGESVRDAISRTPTYQKNSVPQRRYVDEDVPTGLVPLEAIAKLLGVPSEPITRIIDDYDRWSGGSSRRIGRSLAGVSASEAVSYLQGFRSPTPGDRGRP